MNDDLRAVKLTRPAPIQGWAESAEGQAVFDAVLDRTRNELTVTAPRHRRRLAIAGVGLATLGIGVGAAAAGGFAFAPTKDGAKGHGMCAQNLTKDTALSEPTTAFDPKDPAKACATGWNEMFPGTAKPTRFVACHFPNATGPVIYPAAHFTDPTTACASIGTKPIALPNDK